MTNAAAADYTIVIGLEVHVQLLTESKLFCGCSTRFGSPPNTQTCPVCIGMPGVLPVMNRRAFELAMKAALALNCRIARFTKWDRKNYYYPDLPKGYQISQYDLPFSSEGWLEIDDPAGEGVRRIGIIRAHLEEDAGKSMHDEVAGRADSRIDLNRTGTPLLEIVTKPDIRSPEEAKAFLTELKLLLNYIGVSDCNMQEGSLRVDANINLHIPTEDGTVATPIVEIKNMGSFRAVERALAYEAKRQYEVFLETGHRLGDVPKQTRGWDEEAQVTRAQRSKEESSDYRYFPDPDLVPVTVTDEEVDAVRASLGELPAELRRELREEYGLPAYDAGVIVSQGREFVAYFRKLAECCGEPKIAANWLQQDVLRTLNAQGITIDAFPLSAETLGELLTRVVAKRLDTARARKVFEYLVENGGSVEQALSALQFEEVDESEIEALCRELVEQNPDVVAKVKAGNPKVIGRLVGLAKKRNPNVNPAQVQKRCQELIDQM
ncbi:MAG: Asp-tRNA(Asn)/Glu-tRNA(Gln) amidotransferase subunit GatB [Planctomycetota bacterium]|nr:MAG: Asp-tRNA(Asn)/Glu-tRNA(Gln) amidotransferase subunit GatB [Planctomycetota bacterium]